MWRLGFLLFPFFLAIGAVQIYLGSLGIAHFLGFIGTVVVLVAALLLRILLPLSIGSYFGATVVMGWPWWVGLLIAAPGLIFILPSIVMMALEPIFGRR